MRVHYIHSTAHLLMPKIIGVILIILLVAILICDYHKTTERGEKKRKKLVFAEGLDKVKLFGSFGLFAVYIALLEPLGFLLSSILAMFGFNFIFEGTKDKMSIVISGISAVIFPLMIWFVFGYVFNITLP